MRRLASPILYALMVGYPVLVYFGLQHFSLITLALSLVALAALRIMLLWADLRNNSLPLYLALLLLVVAGYSFATDQQEGFRWYPVLVNVLLLGVFSVSLMQGETVVEKIARAQSGPLSESGVIYTRKVTIAWCLFFVANGCAAAWTAIFSSLEVWTLYNGAVSYALIGLFFGAEWLLRQRTLERNNENTI